MDRIMRPVWAEIDLDIIAKNMINIKKIVGDKEIMAVVKADCYGHGSCEVTRTLLENGASRLAVAMISEAIKLRKSYITAPIMILGYSPIYFADDLIKYDIEQTIYDFEYAKELSEIAEKANKKAKVHIAIDTGMGRIGFLPTPESINTIGEICALPGLDVIGIFTHFSSSDELNKDYTFEQFDKMNYVLHRLKEMNIHIPFSHASNSGAIIDMPNTYLDCVRAGIILYGYYPSNEVDKCKLDVTPALTLKARIAHVKELDKNMYVGYNRTFKTSRKSIIATIPIGYADGYSRKLSNNGKVIVNGKLAPIVGNVCMDQLMIDVTDVGPVKTGDEVVLLGQVGNTKYNADDMAKDIGTINYEVLCALKNRVPKTFIKNGQIYRVIND